MSLSCKTQSEATPLLGVVKQTNTAAAWCLCLIMVALIASATVSIPLVSSILGLGYPQRKHEHLASSLENVGLLDHNKGIVPGFLKNIADLSRQRDGQDFQHLYGPISRPDYAANANADDSLPTDPGPAGWTVPPNAGIGKAEYKVLKAGGIDLRLLGKQFPLESSSGALELVAIADSFAWDLIEQIDFHRVTFIGDKGSLEEAARATDAWLKAQKISSSHFGWQPQNEKGLQRLKRNLARQPPRFFRFLPEFDSRGRIVLLYLGKLRRWENDAETQKLIEAGVPRIERTGIVAPLTNTERAMYNHLRTRIRAPVILPMYEPYVESWSWMLDAHLWWMWQVNQLIVGTAVEVMPESFFKRDVFFRYETEAKRGLHSYSIDCATEENVRAPCEPTSQFASSIFARDYILTSRERFDTVVLHLLIGEGRPNFKEADLLDVIRKAVARKPQRIVISEFGPGAKDLEAGEGYTYSQERLRNLVREASYSAYQVVGMASTPGHGYAARVVYAILEPSDNPPPSWEAARNTFIVRESLSSSPHKDATWAHNYDPYCPVFFGPTDSTNIWEEWLEDPSRRVPSMNVLMTVAGGMTGLFVLNALSEPPQQLVIFDVNPSQVRYMKLVLELLLMSNTRISFVNRLFGRRLNSVPQALTVEGTVRRELDRVPIDEDLIANTKVALSSESVWAYENFLEPHVIRTEPGGHRMLWPAWPLRSNGQQKDMPSLGDINGYRQLFKGRTSSIYHGQAGFMKTEERYQYLVTMIRSIPDLVVAEFDVAKLSAMDLRVAKIAAGKRIALFVSNIPDFVPGGRDGLERNLQKLVSAPLESNNSNYSKIRVMQSYRGSSIISSGDVPSAKEKASPDRSACVFMVTGHNRVGGRTIEASEVTATSIRKSRDESIHCSGRDGVWR